MAAHRSKGTKMIRRKAQKRSRKKNLGLIKKARKVVQPKHLKTPKVF